MIVNLSLQRKNFEVQLTKGTQMTLKIADYVKWSRMGSILSYDCGAHFVGYR